jgi:hypothetical protein
MVKTKQSRGRHKFHTESEKTKELYYFIIIFKQDRNRKLPRLVQKVLVFKCKAVPLHTMEMLEG